MLVLALDTATPATTVAVVDATDGAHRVLAQRTEVAANRHGEVLAPLVDGCLTAAGVGRTDFGMVAVGTGPGPFTGLRVGLVTARALGDALGIDVRGVCSLDVIAAGQHAPGHPVVVVTDARRREVYWAAYDEQGTRVAGPAVDRPAELAAKLRADRPETVVVGPGLALHAAAFEGLATAGADAFPDAARLAELAVDGRLAGPPEPLYLRRPDARPPGPRKQVTPA